MRSKSGAELKKMLTTKNLSQNLAEIVTKSLV